MNDNLLSFISLLISSTISTPSSTTRLFSVAGNGVIHASDIRYEGLTPKFSRVPVIVRGIIFASIIRPSLWVCTMAIVYSLRPRTVLVNCFQLFALCFLILLHIFASLFNYFKSLNKIFWYKGLGRVWKDCCWGWVRGSPTYYIIIEIIRQGVTILSTALAWDWR